MFAAGSRHRSGPLSVVAHRQADAFGVGFKIGRRVGNAVRRNHLRRRLRAILEAWEPVPGNGACLVILPDRQCQALAFRELDERLSGILRKLGFRPKHPQVRKP